MKKSTSLEKELDNREKKCKLREKNSLQPCTQKPTKTAAHQGTTKIVNKSK